MLARESVYFYFLHQMEKTNGHLKRFDMDMAILIGTREIFNVERRPRIVIIIKNHIFIASSFRCVSE